MADWQPIDTAPKDGTEIIGVYVCQWEWEAKPTVYGPWTIRFDRKWMASHDGSGVVEYMSDFGTEWKEAEVDPTHWMPMPEAPAT